MHGVVRTDATGAPIAGAAVACVDCRDSTWSGPDGAYVLHGLTVGRHHLRFAARGYDDLILDITLPGTAPLALDVALTRTATPLPVVVVRAPGTVRASSGADSTDAWRVEGAAVRASPAVDEPDLFRALATAPTAQMTVELPTALHVRGGSGDQNLFLLDGVPVYSPVHPGRLASAFSPDIVDELIVNGAAPSARYGGRLASVVEVRTPSAFTPRFAAGNIGQTSASAAVAVPLVPGTASLLLGARRSYAGARDDGDAAREIPGSWSDGLAKLELRLGGSRVALSAFAADNGIGFPAGRAELRNRFGWLTTTTALAADVPLPRSATLAVRAWRAHFGASASWAPDSARLAMRDTLDESGATATFTQPHRDGSFVAGASLEQPRTRYAIDASGTPDSASALDLSAAPTILSLFLEETWRPAARWTLTTGLRGTSLDRGAARLEPRLAATYALAPRVTLSAGYARMHQYTQSMRNEESLLGAVLAPDLLAAAGAPGVPVARSDELTAAVGATLGEHARLRVEWYDRAMRGLVLVAPVSSAPFATTALASGGGRASGAGASLTWQDARVDLLGSYQVSSVDRAPDQGEYRVAFAPTQAGVLAAGVRVARHTAVRSMLSATSSRVATLVAGPLDWRTGDATTANRQLGGTPSLAGPLGGMPLPMYVRLDLGARQTLPLGSDGGIDAFASVDNVLGRRNRIGYAIDAAGREHALGMQPQTFVCGLSWRL